jgi:peptidoglycan/LPS O-acetylase OafA/YrhL
MRIPRHIPQLDILRGIAVLVVMLAHSSGNVPSLHLNPVFRYGRTGVDLFFVLSGFLITGILLRTKDDSGYLVNFYARRALRIWPLYLCVLAFGFLVVPIVQAQMRPTVFEQCHPWQAYLVFVQNILVPKGGTFGPLEVTWSLCVEEQFYLVWPLVVLLFSPRNTAKIALGAAFLSLGLRFASAQHWLAIDFYHNTLCRLDGLALGGLAAIVLPAVDEKRVSIYAPWLAGLALAGAVASVPLGWGKWAFPGFVSLLFVSAMCLSMVWSKFPKFGFLAFTGRISYGLYLLHAPAYDFVRDRHIRPLLAVTQSVVGNDILVLACSLALAYALAWTSWKVLESPALSLKRYFEVRPDASQGNGKCIPVTATPAM